MLPLSLSLSLSLSPALFFFSAFSLQVVWSGRRGLVSLYLGTRGRRHCGEHWYASRMTHSWLTHDSLMHDSLTHSWLTHSLAHFMAVGEGVTSVKVGDKVVSTRVYESWLSTWYDTLYVLWVVSGLISLCVCVCVCVCVCALMSNTSLPPGTVLHPGMQGSRLHLLCLEEDQPLPCHPQHTRQGSDAWWHQPFLVQRPDLIPLHGHQYLLWVHRGGGDLVC